MQALLDDINYPKTTFIYLSRVMNVAAIISEREKANGGGEELKIYHSLMGKVF